MIFDFSEAILNFMKKLVIVKYLGNKWELIKFNCKQFKSRIYFSYYNLSYFEQLNWFFLCLMILITFILFHYIKIRKLNPKSVFFD
jgi:hypothetical protein